MNTDQTPTPEEPGATPKRSPKRESRLSASEQEAASLRQLIVEREALKKLEAQRQRHKSLINPLGESPDARPCLPIPFTKAVLNAFASRGQTLVFEAIQKAALEILPASQSTLPRAFYLALVSPDLERFLRYLPDVRMECEGRG
jgi:hypothetical protein